MVFFDVPSVGKDNQREYRKFRKELIRKGFLQYQESVYVRLFRSPAGIPQVVSDIRDAAPVGGLVSVLPMTFRQFSRIVCLGENRFDMSVFADDVAFF